MAAYTGIKPRTNLTLEQHAARYWSPRREDYAGVTAQAMKARPITPPSGLIWPRRPSTK